MNYALEQSNEQQIELMYWSLINEVDKMEINMSCQQTTWKVQTTLITRSAFIEIFTLEIETMHHK